MKFGDIYIQNNEYKAMVIGFLRNDKIKFAYLHNGVTFATNKLEEENIILFEEFKENPTSEEIIERQSLIKKSYI